MEVQKYNSSDNKLSSHFCHPLPAVDRVPLMVNLYKRK